MNPSNDMCTASVSTNNFEQKRKQTTGNSCTRSIPIDKSTSKLPKQTDAILSCNTNSIKQQTSTMLQCKEANVENQYKTHLHFDILTEENFHYAHLYNRNIDELPNININEIEQLKLFGVYTMQDLLGRFLIHDTTEEFYIFLIKSFQLNEKLASTLTKLFYQWTIYNIDGSIDNINR